MLGRYGASEVEAEEAMYGNPYYARNQAVSNSIMMEEGEVRQSVNLAASRHSRVRSSTNYDYKVGLQPPMLNHNASRESASNRGEKQDYSMMLDENNSTMDQHNQN